MDPFFFISISIVVLASPIAAHHGISCKQDESKAFNICGHSDVITSVSQTRDSYCLALDLNDFSSIAPSALRNLTISWLELSYPDSENCIPKDVELTPESFNGVSSVDTLELKCVKFSVEPNPFKNFKSLISLWLKSVDFTGARGEFLADFPRLETLGMFDLNLTTISPDIFSKTNRELKQLFVYDGILVVEPKSFEKFHHLDSLTLNDGQLAELRSDMFDGLNKLNSLVVNRNKITKLRRNAFSKLPQLEALELQNNKISEIEFGTFSDLHLRKLELGNNDLESLPTDVFQNLTNLEYLDLHSNKIRTVPHDVFKGCVNLRYLLLNGNEINHIEPEAFWGLHLKRFSLGYNNINVLEPDTFSGLRIESSLDLRHNNITVVKPQAFRNLKGGKISLSCHNMTEVDRENWGVDDSIKKIDVIAYKA